MHRALSRAFEKLCQYRAVVREGVNSRRFLAPSLAVLVLFASPRALSQQAVEPPVLLGGDDSVPAKEPPRLDPRLPTGTEVRSPIERPRTTEPAACSFRRPVCVQREAGAPPERAAQALASLEAAYERLVLALGLPAPVPDAGLGGSDALDLYLRTAGSAELSVGGEPVSGDFDRAAGFCVLGSAAPEFFDRAATQCVAEAIALRLDAGETPHLRRAYATHLWFATGYRTTRDAEAIDDAQANPELPLIASEQTASSEAAALFFEYLEETRGTGTPGALATGLLALSASRTPPGAWLWNNEPDVVDVLRHTYGNKRPEYAGMFGRFAVARAFSGDREDGSHFAAADWTGAFGSIRFDWSIKFSSLPRRVLSSRSIFPTGAEYVWLDLDEVPLGAALYFQAEWEHPVPFKWVVVRVDKEGRELSRVDVPYQEGGTSAEQRVVDLEAAAGLVIVGVNMGDMSPTYPFDPDIAPFEPQRCTIYLARL
jgi:hypothetical protein